MDEDTTYVAIDDSKRTLVVGILRPGDREPALRENLGGPKPLSCPPPRARRQPSWRVPRVAGV